mmetsp:Transcript_9904/g.26337  ORF Transcript_9904/g.26337 Transcript_9904/m.26337 type:complete len:191 (-) Transcript_9904:1456-2028(-)
MSSKTTIPGVKTKVDMTPTFIVTGGFMRSGLRSNSRSDYGALRCGLRGTKAVATAMNIRRSVDYSVYLVTDRTIATRAGLSLEKSVEEALRGGVSVVQLREKNVGTREIVATGRRLLKITREYGVPLIVNDRVDVALAIDADGVHVGQDDMHAADARRLIGGSRILGVSAGTVEEALEAQRNGADYVGGM